MTATLAFRETHVPRMLALGRCRADVEVEVLLLKESLDLTDADRAGIVQACVACAETRIVITHGTDTIVETARAIAAAVHERTVVLTGAMMPFAFGGADGLFSLGLIETVGATRDAIRGVTRAPSIGQDVSCNIGMSKVALANG